MAWLPVKCPHCGTSGQLMLPAQSAMVIGPCPVCREFVVVFCGATLALEKDIFITGSNEDKRRHLMRTLVDFLRERVAEVVRNTQPGATPEEPAEEYEEPDYAGAEEEYSVAEVLDASADISQAEVDQFVKIELDLLDNRDYFKTVFE